MSVKFENDPEANARLESLSIRMLVINPVIAERMLAHNVSNRPIRKNVVEAYADDMRNGRWEMVADAIRFADDKSEDNPFGSLLDGQHRLKAIIMSSTVQPMTIVQGLAPDSQKYMDSGVKRLAADNITMAGLRHGTRVSGVTRQILSIENGAVHSNGARYSNAYVVEFLQSNPSIMDAVLMTKDIRKLISLAPAIAGAVAFYGNLVRPTATKDFFRRLTARYGSNPHDPAVLLGNRLESKVGSSLTRQQQIWLTFRALNMDLESINTLTRLSLPMGTGGKKLTDSPAIVAEKNRLLAQETEVKPEGEPNA